jgi:calcineurin-like phosphoesterase family protein
MRYKPGNNQYSDREMNRRIRKKWLSLQWHQGFDILLSHSPAFGIQDGDDLPHKGFKGFVDLLNNYKPRYFVHGHSHLCYDSSYKRVLQHNDTTIINAYGYHIFECEPIWKPSRLIGKTLTKPKYY